MNFVLTIVTNKYIDKDVVYLIDKIVSNFVQETRDF